MRRSPQEHDPLCATREDVGQTTRGGLARCVRPSDSTADDRRGASALAMKRATPIVSVVALVLCALYSKYAIARHRSVLVV